MNKTSTRRRRLLLSAGSLVFAPLFGTAAPNKPTSSKRPYAIAQVVDTSMAQQDVSKDILIGARAAWQDINAQGGIDGHEINQVTFEVDGSPKGLQDALQSLGNDPKCIAISAAAGERAALELVMQLQMSNLVMANVAPWLQDSTLQVNERTFPIFATRQEQVGYAMRELLKQGIRDVAAVYATQQDFRQYRVDIDNIAKDLKLNMRTFAPTGDVATMSEPVRNFVCEA
jgi:ABC-type branched-subunit amino acid transport system substrate-binding protein